MNIKKYILIVLTTVLLLCPYYLAINTASVSGGLMEWSTIETPGSKNNLIVSPSEVNFMALSPDGITMFVTDIPHKKLYKSSDSGFSWKDISSLLTSAGASFPVWNIMVAPDNPNMVVAVTSSTGLPRNVFISIDGGNSWQNLNCPTTSNIASLDISKFHGNYDIAIGTRTGTGEGKLLVFKMSGTGNWVDQGISSDILSIAFSPNYSSDSSIVVVSANMIGCFLNLGIRDFVANTTIWNSWNPREITVTNPGTSPKANQVKTADLELPSDFTGQISSTRRFFVSTNDGGLTGSSGIFRIDDAMIYSIMPASGNKMISSISYTGSTSGGKLLAGEVKANVSTASVDVWYCLNPMAICPQSNCIQWQKAAKPPTGGAGSGNANALVAWGHDGNKAYCATSSADLTGAGWPSGYLTTMAWDESAFSYSIDGGNTWNQSGLIDTEISWLADVHPAFNNDTLYLASINTHTGFNGFDSIWKSHGYPQFKTWERIFCFLSNSNEIILRGDITNPNQIFCADRNSSRLCQSSDKGQTWNLLDTGLSIVDFQLAVIKDIPTLLVLSPNTIRKAEYTGAFWKWGQNFFTGLSSSHTVTSTPAGALVIGDGGQGLVSYSLDAGSKFTTLPPLPVTGNVHVIADNRIKSPIIIYAASDDPDSQIYGWIVGSSSRWISMEPPRQSYYALAQLNTFYGCWSSGGASGTVRTLNPEVLRPPYIEWDKMTSGLAAGVLFTREPGALKSSAGINLWAIDNRPYSSNTGRLWYYYDALSSGPPIIPTPIIPVPITPSPIPETPVPEPIPVSPIQDAVFTPESATGEIPAITFSWQPSTPARGYDLLIAKDIAFNQLVWQQSLTPDDVNSPKWTLSSPGTLLQTGMTYYWKVRVNRAAYTNQKVEGKWSSVSTFSITQREIPKTPEPPPVLQAPTLLQPPDNSTNKEHFLTFSWLPIPDVTEYQFILARDFSMQQILIEYKTSAITYTNNIELTPGSTYFWQVRATKPYIGPTSSAFSFSIVEEKVIPPPATTTIVIWPYIVIIVALILGLTITTVLLIKMKSAKRTA
jgi:hypothetical protein